MDALILAEAWVRIDREQGIMGCDARFIAALQFNSRGNMRPREKVYILRYPHSRPKPAWIPRSLCWGWAIKNSAGEWQAGPLYTKFETADRRARKAHGDDGYSSKERVSRACAVLALDYDGNQLAAQQLAFSKAPADG